MSVYLPTAVLLAEINVLLYSTVRNFRLRRGSTVPSVLCGVALPRLTDAPMPVLT
jgi:hypothetical protein